MKRQRRFLKRIYLKLKGLKMNKKMVMILLLLLPMASYAASPTCHTNPSGNYCQYIGKVTQIYINSSNLILLYFEEPIDIADANSYGMNISNGSAAAFLVSDNPTFAQMFYSTALAAQASGRTVTIQMRGSQNGYLKFDRIWLPQP
jgi:hypothetical protein